MRKSKTFCSNYLTNFHSIWMNFGILLRLVGVMKTYSFYTIHLIFKGATIDRLSICSSCVSVFCCCFLLLLLSAPLKSGIVYAFFWTWPWLRVRRSAESHACAVLLAAQLSADREKTLRGV